MTSASEWQLKISALMDSSGLEKGATASEAAVKGLEQQVETSTESINTSLRHMDDGVSSTLGPSGTLSHGTSGAKEQLKELRNNAAEEMSGFATDLQSGAAGAAQGLASAFAPLGPAGIAVSLALAGFSILKSRSDAAAQAIRDNINSALDSIEVNAKQSNQQIIESYESTLTLQKTIEQLGNGDKAKGFELLKQHADNLGVSVSTIVAFINRQWTPAALELRNRLREQRDLVDEQNSKVQDGSRFAYRLGGDWQFIADQQDKAYQTQKSAVQIAEQMRNYARDTADATARMAANLQASEARAQGVANKLAAAANYYNGLPQ